ncbi:MAG: hypothetical protein HY680_04895 [Chloroflexi bacterium]|nr:hypothetical protein [Chloroflexota bacterium]
MTDSYLSIGSRLEVIPMSPLAGDAWSAQSSFLPAGWSCNLIHRASATILPGQPLTGWMLNVDTDRHHVEVTDSNFGFLPISDRMRPRYVTCLGRVEKLLKKEDEIGASDAHCISEVKGMFSRCARRDQWDWRAVHLALGEPSRGEARSTAGILGEVSGALRRGDMATARVGLEELAVGRHMARTLQAAREAVERSVTALPQSRVLRGRGATGRQPDASVRSVVSSYAKEKLESANATHTMLLDILGQFLGAQGHRVEANQFVDTFTRLKSGPAIFEAKSITDDNELAQIRHGLSQLYEYRYRYDLKDATLWLVLSREPREGWVINYLEKDRGVHIIWLERGELSGPSVERLLETGSEALRQSRKA